MEYRILGKTGLKISRMGFGGIPIQRIDAEGTKALMRKLLENGVNYIDTARGYTVSEEYLGIGLEGIREHFVLATKSMSRTAEAMAKDIDISLKNLRTDYIDLYQIHNAPPADVEKVCSPGGALEALTAAKKAGKIGHIGITAHSLETFRMALELPWVETDPRLRRKEHWLHRHEAPCGRRDRGRRDGAALRLRQPGCHRGDTRHGGRCRAESESRRSKR